MAASKDACFIKTFRAKIVPERLRSFVMPADGVVSNWIPADGRVQKDTIIATVNEDEIELERKELEVKILKDRIAKEEELSKLEKQLEEIEFYSSLTREERQYASKQAEGGERAIRALKDHGVTTKILTGDNDKVTRTRLSFPKGSCPWWRTSRVWIFARRRKNISSECLLTGSCSTSFPFHRITA